MAWKVEMKQIGHEMLRTKQNICDMVNAVAVAGTNGLEIQVGSPLVVG